MKKGSIFMVVAIIAISIFSGCNSSVNSIDNYEGDLYLMDLAEKLVKDQNDTEFKKVSDELSELSTNEKITVLRFGRQISPINDSPENEKYLQEMEVIASEYFDKSIIDLSDEELKFVAGEVLPIKSKSRELVKNCGWKHYGNSIAFKWSIPRKVKKYRPYAYKFYRSSKNSTDCDIQLRFKKRNQKYISATSWWTKSMLSSYRRIHTNKKKYKIIIGAARARAACNTWGDDSATARCLMKEVVIFNK